MSRFRSYSLFLGRLAPGILFGALLVVGPLSAADRKVEIHGFLTQAWGTTDFVDGPLSALAGSPTEAERLLGLEEGGTFDYRNLALQFRYAITDRDIMLLQLSHEATGISPVDDERDEIELDWGFYERRIGHNTSVKVGRIPIPYGIYNEIRDVGTILPFFRPPYSNYLEGAFTSETVDGVTLAQNFAVESPWSLDLDLYIGQFETFEFSPITFGALAVTSDVVGIQLWLNTPLDGLRFGYSYQDREEEGGFFRLPDQPTDSESWMASVEAAFHRWSFRTEYRIFEPFIPAGLLGPVRVDLELLSWYAQLGWRISDLIQLYAQVELQGVEQENPLVVNGPVDFDNRDDFGVAINISFSSQVVLKAEYHWVEQEGPQFTPVLTPQGPGLRADILSADGGNYAILALSTSF
ncbi:MAG: hypothetical protein MPN21_14680 [Thermoanaerobaculia bacterium]|nr:hypothetical protein [Thermoanaerobaculia bacterium]